MHKCLRTESVPGKSHALWDLCITTICIVSMSTVATTLREMLNTTKAIPNLEVIPDMTHVIKEITHQLLETAVLIQEYTKMSFGGNLVPHLHDPAESNHALFVVHAARILI